MKNYNNGRNRWNGILRDYKEDYNIAQDKLSNLEIIINENTREKTSNGLGVVDTYGSKYNDRIYETSRNVEYKWR